MKAMVILASLAALLIAETPVPDSLKTDSLEARPTKAQIDSLRAEVAQMHRADSLMADRQARTNRGCLAVAIMLAIVAGVVLGLKVFNTGPH